jgi:hypothetical protein
LGIPQPFYESTKGVMATLQERRLGYHSRMGLEPGTSRFSTLRLNHYAARGTFDSSLQGFAGVVNALSTNKIYDL